MILQGSRHAVISRYNFNIYIYIEWVSLAVSYCNNTELKALGNRSLTDTIVINEAIQCL